MSRATGVRSNFRMRREASMRVLPATRRSQRSLHALLSFDDIVYPRPKNFVVGFYYNEPLHNVGAAAVVPTTNQFTGAIETDVPNFYLPKPQFGDHPVSLQECINIIQTSKDPLGCLEYTTNPFLTAVDVQLRTFGLTGAWQAGKFSVGVS